MVSFMAEQMEMAREEMVFQGMALTTLAVTSLILHTKLRRGYLESLPLFWQQVSAS